MIDTIVLRIQNLSNYKFIYEKYYYAQKGAVTVAVVNEQTGEIMERSEMPAMVYHDTNSILPLIHRSNFNIPSSHYSVSYFINTTRDFIEFNLSVPKYLFGNNVLQFVSRYNYAVDHTFGLLYRFLMDFKREYLYNHVLDNDIEVNRIDCCYNQFFNSKEDALTYLDQQKNLLTQFARSSKNNYRSYDTSFMYITRRYSFKIYHKGTEFEKHDWKKMYELIGKKYTAKDVEKVHEVADTCLRYEMTFRNTFLSHLANEYFFNRKYLKAENLPHLFVSSHPAVIAVKDLRLPIDYRTCPKVFTLKSLVNEPGRMVLPNDYKGFPFDWKMFQVCWLEFWQRVEQYQINVVFSPDALDLKIKEYNDRAKAMNRYMAKGDEVGTKYASTLKMFAMLTNFIDPNSLNKLLPRTTVYNMKKRAKDLGLELGNGRLNIPVPQLGYLDYFRELGLIHHDYYF